MSTLTDQIKEQFKQGDNLTKIIYLNVGVYIVMLILQMLSFLITGHAEQFERFIITWLALPSDPVLFITRPWTLVTYMFLHAGFWHLFWNLIILFFSGRIFLEYLGDRRLLTVFLYGGIAGGMLFFILYNISPAFNSSAPLVGASAGVVAILVAAATYVPHMPVRLFFILEVKLWMVAALAVVSYIAGVGGTNTGGHLAHLGGAALGYLFVTQLRKGNDWSIGFYHLLDTIEGWFTPKPKMKTVHNAGRKRSTSTAKNSASDQQRMDEILDKISKSGYDKLTKEEKDFLFKIGKK